MTTATALDRYPTRTPGPTPFAAPRPRPDFIASRSVAPVGEKQTR